ncbi:phage adaptor protein [Citrobacter sp. OP27]
MSTTYDNILAAVKATSGRTDSQTINAMPQFIAAAQTKLDSLLRVGSMSSKVTYNTDDVSVDASEFLKIESVTIGGLVGTATTYTKITALRKLVESRPETAGYDFHYAMNGNDIELVKPNTVLVTGYKKPPRISSTVQTNAYTEGAENAILWLALFYCANFCRDEGAGNWQALATDEVDTLNATRDQFSKTGTAKVKRHGGF